jgi:hypothetical protein
LIASLLWIGPSVFAAEKLTMNMVLNPACGPSCPFDAVAKSSLKISNTSKAGSNGLAGKFLVSGATLAGAPVSTGSFELYFGFSLNGGPCQYFYSPPVPVTAGKASFAFTGASIGLSAPAGTTVNLCDFSASYSDGITLVLVPGFHLGTP